MMLQYKFPRMEKTIYLNFIIGETLSANKACFTIDQAKLYLLSIIYYLFPIPLAIWGMVY